MIQPQLAMESETAEVAQRLVESLKAYRSVAVAFSGGVDSAVVAKAAAEALGASVVAITGIGAALPASDLGSARSLAASIGIRHVELPTDEIDNPDYVRNDADRCFHCKKTLYGTIRNWANKNSVETILSGTNFDDLADYRPGLLAAADEQVVAPLADLRIAKVQVRQLAKFWQLAVADKPASPCLASRIAYGQSVTQERLRSIESIEQMLAGMGFTDVRVRLHENGLIRLELSLDDLRGAIEPEVRQRIVAHTRDLGFQFVTMDLAGRQSGSLNRLLPIIQ